MSNSTAPSSLLETRRRKLSVGRDYVGKNREGFEVASFTQNGEENMESELLDKSGTSKADPPRNAKTSKLRETSQNLTTNVASKTVALPKDRKPFRLHRELYKDCQLLTMHCIAAEILQTRYVPPSFALTNEMRGALALLDPTLQEIVFGCKRCIPDLFKKDSTGRFPHIVPLAGGLHEFVQEGTLAPVDSEKLVAMLSKGTYYNLPPLWKFGAPSRNQIERTVPMTDLANFAVPYVSEVKEWREVKLTRCLVSLPLSRGPLELTHHSF